MEHIDRKIQSDKKSNFTSIDLFCGAGGLTEGLKWVGIDTILGIDNWSPACKTYAHNHPTADVINTDISTLKFDAIKDYFSSEIGFFCGGPPCQGFSSAGKKLLDDPRNFLFKNFLDIVGQCNPCWVIMENVPDLLRNFAVFQDIKNLFSNLGYEVQYKLINSATLGVPQKRTRVFFVAKRSDIKTSQEFNLDSGLKPIFVEEEDLFNNPIYITFDEATSDLPYLESGQGSDEINYSNDPKSKYQEYLRGYISLSKFFDSKSVDISIHTENINPKSECVYNHIASDHDETLIERFKVIPEGGTKKDLKRLRPDLLPPDGHDKQGLTYGRLWKDRPAGTIPANYGTPSGNRSIHPSIPRIITPREAMRLSSFPDYFKMFGSKVDYQFLIGNAVMPLVAFHIGNYIMNIWDRNGK